MNSNILAVYEQRPRRFKKMAKILIPLAIVIFWSSLYVDYRGIDKNGFTVIQSILKGRVNPSWNLLLSVKIGSVTRMILETVTIAFLGTLIGMVLTLPLSFLSASNIVPKWVSSLGVLLITMIRTFPPFVY